MKKFLIFVTLAAVAWFAWDKFTAASAVSPRAAGKGVAVVLYSTDWCGYCRKAKDFFTAHGIAYVELDIEKDTQARGEFERLGGRGVPLVVIGETVIRGYDEASMKSALGL